MISRKGTPFLKTAKFLTYLFSLVQLSQTVGQRCVPIEAVVSKWLKQFDWREVFHGNHVVVVDISKVEKLLSDTSEESRPKETCETCLRHVHSAIIVFVKTIKDNFQQVDNFDVIKLMDGNFPIFVGIKVGDQKRMNLVKPSRLIPCPQVVRIQQILEGIPRGFGQE